MTPSEPDASGSSTSAGTPRASWRGNKSAPRASAPPAWRSQPQELPSRLVDRQRFRRIVGILLCFCLAAALFGLLVRDLVFYPRMVPFIALSVNQYSAPLPPNGWAREDLSQFLAPSTGLHQKTMIVSDLSLELRSRDRARQAFRQSLQQNRANALHAGSLMVFVSMHGFVNDKNEVAFLLPDSDPVNSDSWWPLQDVIQEINNLQLPEQTLKLLILDCNRELTYWPAGIVCNHVASRLEAEVARANVPNLVILNSTSPGERGWQSRDMHGSVFAQFLRVGLAGAADRRSQGTRNRQITLKELHEYLVQTVDQWAWSHRRSHQRPLLVPHDAANFTLTWSLGGSELDGILAEAATQATPVPSVTIDAVSRLWFDFSQLQRAGRFRVDPMQEASLTQQLLWLESALLAGADYSAPALELARQLEETLSALQSPVDPPSQILQELSENGLTTPDQLPRGVVFDSVPLGVRFQSISNNVASLVNSEIQQVIATPSLQSLQAAIHRLSAEKSAVSLAELHFLRLLAQYVPALPSSCLEHIPDLLKLEQLAAQVAVPEDERHSRWLVPLIDAGDNARRAAFDNWTNSQPLAEQIVSANQSYAAAMRLTRDLSRALILRDRVTADLPYLAQWVSRPAWPARRAAEQTQLVQEVLPRIEISLANLHRALDRVVTRDDVAQLMESTPFQSQFDDLNENYSQVRGLIDAEYERLLNTKDTPPQVLYDIIELLRLPLLPQKNSLNGLAPFAQRTSLQELGLQISTDLQTQAPPFTHIDPRPTQTTDSLADIEAQAARWSPHPIITSLGLPRDVAHSDATRTDDVLTALGTRVRRYLAGVPAQLDARDREAHDSPEDPRALLSLNTRLLRSVAAVLSRPPHIKPSLEAQLYDMRQLLLNAANRRLIDFWSLAGTQSSPYFAVTALTDLTLARQLMEPGPFAQTNFSRLRQLLNDRSAAANAGLNISATDVLLIESLATIPATMRISPAVGLSATAFPVGKACAWLRPSDSPRPVAQQPFALPLSAGPSGSPKPQTAQTNLTFQLTPDEFGQTDPQWDGVVSFRGHEFLSSFLAHLPQGAVTDFEPFQAKSSSVMISGGPLKRESILFILDCSQSMSQPAVAESPGMAPARISVASTAMIGMLTRLAARKDIQVGVQFFGHRVGWNTKQPGQLLPQVNYGRPIPAGLQPFEDVELVLPLGRFDPSWEQSIATLLKTVQPWGESPIYLSIIRALTLFENSSQNEVQTIVIITDGLNYQFNPTAASRKQLSDVVSAIKGRPIAIHIVGFGIDAKDEPVAEREFGTLAQLTQGSYTTVDRASELVDSLEKILAVQDFTVAPVAGIPVQSPVGKPVMIPGPFVPPPQVTASLGRASLSVPLTGGEAVELLPSPSGTQLQSARYDKELIQQFPLTGTDAGSTLLFGVHRAVRREDGVMFEFSLQDLQRKYVPRPHCWWLTITPGPIGSLENNAPFIFYDPEYVPNMPVPLVRWLANGFPLSQKQAYVQAWTRQQLPPAVLQYDLKSDLTNAIQNGASLTLPSIPNVTLDIRVRPGDEDRIDVVEQHVDAITTDDLLHVQLSTDRTINRVVRRFDLYQQVVVNMFLLSNDPRKLSDRLANTSVEVRTFRSIKAGALRLSEPVQVEISTEHGLVRPTLLPPDTP